MVNEKKPANAASDVGRPPPNDVELEKVVLATLLLVAHAAFRLRGVLKVDHFFAEQHKIIYQAIVEVMNAGTPVDLFTVKAQLQATGKREAAGGASYLSEISQNATAGENLTSYAERLVELSTRRTAKEWAVTFRSEVHDVPDAGDYLVTKARELAKLAHTSSGQSDLAPIYGSVHVCMSEAQQRRQGQAIMRYTPTGYTGLDRKLGGGMGDEELIVLAGRPGSGKTSLMLGIAGNIGVPIPPEAPIHIPELGVAVFELEMPRPQITGRLICMGARIPFQHWKTGEIDDERWIHTSTAAGDLAVSNIWIDDSTDLTMSDIEAKVAALQSEWNRPATFAKCPVCQIGDFVHNPLINRWHCPLCVPDPTRAGAYTIDARQQLTRERRIAQVQIDNASLVKEERMTYSREREVAELSKHAKQMSKSKRLNCSVLLLVHLSREVDKRKGKERYPQMSDLRESGSLEQDADVILFPWRPGASKPDDMKLRYAASVIVGKNRNGPPGEVEMRYEPECSMFTDLQTDLPDGL